MTELEYIYLFDAHPALLTIECLKNKKPRTLLYGYTCARETWHVYIDENHVIRTVEYIRGDDCKEILVEDNRQYIPNKRLYPAKCDYEFCFLLKRAGYDLPFTTYEEVPIPSKYYGKVI